MPERQAPTPVAPGACAPTPSAAPTPTVVPLPRSTLRRWTHDAAPPLQRGHMAPRPWTGALRRLGQRLCGAPPEAPRALPQRPGADDATDRLPVAERRWRRAAHRRRLVLLALVGGAAALAAAVLLQAQPVVLPSGLVPAEEGRSVSWLEMAQGLQVLLFTLLFAWVGAGFVTALMGWHALRRGDAHTLSHAAVAGHRIAPEARTALVMPICNEHVATVFAGLAATAASVVDAGGARLVEIYVLSDSSEPALRHAEWRAWQALRERFAATGLRVHYRWRERRTQRKAGNVADFCRRWGRRHRYMVVLDADSVMSGEAVLGLVRLMEAHPNAGIVQSAPVSCGLDTPHARAQQFAGRITGRLFAAGMQYWQLGESHYWGHNAIIRIAPFMAHCGLAPLPGGTEILSHDFVEAALLRRAGWQVWLCADLPGSWEQQPPHLLAELQRDRRWCQGNLLNARLIGEPGLHRVHRAMLATGAMAYLSAPLWLGFVALGVALWLGGGHVLAPVAGGGLPWAVLALWGATALMLLLPRALGVHLVLAEGREAAHGGRRALVAGALAEALLSALLAPLRMAAHTLFVVAALTGWQLQWRSPPREAQALPWRDALARLGPVSATAGAALAAVAAADAMAALWLLPVALPLLAAVPLAVWGSRPRWGLALRRAGLWLTPEETAPPRVLRHAWAGVHDAATAAPPRTPATAPQPLHPAARSAPAQAPALARPSAPARRAQAATRPPGAGATALPLTHAAR